MSWKEKYKLVVFGEVDSTRLEAMRIAKTNPNQNYIILAKTQTNGRGRHGRSWQSISGNLHINILLKHNIDLNYLSQLSLVTAIAVYKTISSLPSKSKNNIKLKWPNDLLINNKKVSGMILGTVNNDANQYLSIGIGINIIDNPTNIDQVTTNLIDENIEVPDVESLLNLLMINFNKYFSLWKAKGFSKIRQFWLKRAYKLKERITANYGNVKVTGIFTGIDDNGGMQILLDSGKVATLFAD
ncbi:MAG: biotin--[acetyl-CoA-carboxylase] ligase [Candidatus Rickettsia vulgarisii]